MNNTGQSKELPLELQNKIRKSADRKIGLKVLEAKAIRDDIFDYVIRFKFLNNLDEHLYLPKSYKEFKALLVDKWNCPVIDEETGEIIENPSCENNGLLTLAGLYYALSNTGNSCYTLLKDSKQVLRNGTIDSKHRFDPVTNYKKSKAIRRVYSNYLEQTAIYKNYQLVHLTLTVPHKNGIWKGQRFYAKQLIQAFNTFRKTDKWNEYIVGGEYGVEVKKSNSNNGLHIHIHSLVFQKKNFLTSEVKNQLKEVWESLTGSTQFGYESVYYYLKEQVDETKRKKVLLTKFLNESTPEDFEYVEDLEIHFEEQFDFDVNKAVNEHIEKGLVINSPIKIYCNPETSSSQEYIDAILECIKYHYKMDDFILDSGVYDIDLIRDILNNSKNLRMYSRYGILYKEPLLSLKQRHQKDVSEESENQDEEEEIETVQLKTINPINGEVVVFSENIDFAVASPDKLVYKNLKNDFSVENPNQLYVVDKGISRKEIFKNLNLRNYKSLLPLDEYNRLMENKNLDTISNDEILREGRNNRRAKRVKQYTKAPLIESNGEIQKRKSDYFLQ